MMTRRQILWMIAKWPVKLIGFLAMVIYFYVACVLVIIPLVLVMCTPPMLACILSPFVGLISPALGHKMATSIDRAGDRLDILTDWVMIPLDWADGRISKEYYE